MPFSPREFVRHARPFAALALIAGAACSDQNSLMGPQASPSAEVSEVSQVGTSDKLTVADLVAPRFILAASSNPNATVTGTSVKNVRSGPSTSYQLLNTVAAGTRLRVLCTVDRPSSSGTVKWARLVTGDTLNNWLSGLYIEYDAGASVPDCNSAAGPKIASGVRGNDYPYKADDPSGCANDPWQFCLRQCTSFVTWRLRDVNGTAFRLTYGGKGWGSAYKWREVAQSLGYRVDNTPEVGAVAYFAKTATRTAGHVAWVASVSSDRRTVTIEEYNVHTRYGYGTRTMSVASIDNFIHLY